MKQDRAAFYLAAFITFIYIVLVFVRGGAFNIIPSSIYEYFLPVNSWENVFIVFFDILFGILLFIIVYKTIKALWP